MRCLRPPQLRKVERDKKTMDQEIVELTNKLLDAKNTIDRLEELNVRSHEFIQKQSAAYLLSGSINNKSIINM